ncbi:MAG: FemAB family XrtA/PEP-CTERM system-associated protein [Pseudomonadota bacterium]
MNAPVDMAQQVTRLDFDDPAQMERTEAYVAERRASLFHRPIWLKAVEAGTGQRAGGFVAEQLGVITGWLPLSEVRSVLFPPALVSSGFGVGGGIIADSTSAASSLAAAAEDFATRNSFASIDVRGGSIPSGWEQWDDKHCGFKRPLAENDEAELMTIPRKTRAEVRKGLKNDLPFKIGRSDADMMAHYAVYAESVRNLGTPVFPRRLFAAMLEAFPDSSDILTVFKDGAPVASVLSFYHDGAVMPFWGGGTYAARDARANELMYYELMCHARRKGMERFDFGRSKTNSGPYKFKKNWGFEPVPLTYGKWTAPGAEARDVDPTSETYSSKIDLWKKLPLPIANTVGPWIARGLA